MANLPEVALIVLVAGLLLLLAVAIGLNVYILTTGLRMRAQFLGLRDTVARMLALAIEDLGGFENLRMHVPVQVDDTIPVETSVPVNETIHVAVRGTIPVNETIESEITVTAPIIGTKVPVQVSVPVRLKVPVNMEVPVRIVSNIPVSMRVPVKMEIPVEVDLRETEIGEFIEQVLATLVSLQDILDDGQLNGSKPANR